VGRAVSNVDAVQKACGRRGRHARSPPFALPNGLLKPGPGWGATDARVLPRKQMTMSAGNPALSGFRHRLLH